MKKLKQAIKELAAEQVIVKSNRKENVTDRILSQSQACEKHHWQRRKLRYLYAALWIYKNKGDFSTLNQIDKNWDDGSWIERLSSADIIYILEEYA